MPCDGLIALIDDAVPMIVIAPHDATYEEPLSIMREVAARGEKIVLIGDVRGADAAGLDTLAKSKMPDLNLVVAPIVYAVPIELLAYRTPVVLGNTVDQPRNSRNLSQLKKIDIFIIPL